MALNPRFRIPALVAVLFVASLGYYLVSTDHGSDLVLIGTVDANQVIISSQVLGRIDQLPVQEGQDVKAGDLLAVLDPEELSANKAASDAQAQSLRSQADALRASASSATGDTEQAAAGARSSLAAAGAALAEATATRANQEMLTTRTLALAEQGIASAQDRDSAVQALKAAKAHELAAREQMAAAEAALKAARARLDQGLAARENAAASLEQWASAQASAAAAGARLRYTRITSPITGKVGIWAARQGEVVNPGTVILTVVDLGQTWVYAPLPETEADRVQLDDQLRVRMPGGAVVAGKVIAKAAEGDFATQRDVSRRKRDIKTIRIKLLIANPGERFVPGMTAEVLVPRRRPVAK